MSKPEANPALTADAVARAVGEPPECILDWDGLGLLTRDGNGFAPDTVERARLISFAVRRGIAADAIAAASADQGDILGHYLELTGATKPRAAHSIVDAAAAAGLDEAFVRRMLIASGIADQGEPYDDDVEMLRFVAVAIAAGMPPEALLQLTRVFNDALSRVAETENRLFHFYVHERLETEGHRGADLVAAAQAVSEPLLDLVEPAILYFHRKAWERSLREDMLWHLAESAGGRGDAVGQLSITVLFVDLASFTPLTEVMGDLAAADVVERFSDLVREAAGACDGRVLKQIGDEFMLVFPNGHAAVRCGLSLVAKTAAEDQFPDIRIGAHAGPALYREGDYVGATVNVAARVASQAMPAQFLVTNAVREEAGSVEDVWFESIGARALKGISDPLDLFEVRSAERPARPVDPVCGMALDAKSSTVRLEWDGDILMFCSERCRDQFLAAPERYVSRG